MVRVMELIVAASMHLVSVVLTAALIGLASVLPGVGDGIADILPNGTHFTTRASTGVWCVESGDVIGK